MPIDNYLEDSEKLLERGSAHIFHERLRDEDQYPRDTLMHSMSQCFFVFHPYGEPLYRCVVAELRKHSSDYPMFWFRVDAIGSTRDEIASRIGGGSAETLAIQHVPALVEGARGVYTLWNHGNHSHMSFVFEFPEYTTELQSHFGLEETEDFFMSLHEPHRFLPMEIRTRFNISKAQFTELPNREIFNIEGIELLMIDSDDSDSLELLLGVHPSSSEESERIDEILDHLHLFSAESESEEIIEKKREEPPD
jgi:hypothetical protein